MEFEWDEDKGKANEQEHGVSFAEAETVMGTSIDGRLLVISHTDREDRLRIISAREASRRERKDYEDGNFP